MTLARRRCAASTNDFAFFFEPAHADLAERARDMSLQVFAPEEDARGAEAPATHEQLATRCRAIATRLADARLIDPVLPARLGGFAIGRGTSVDVRSICLVREMLGWGSALAEFVFAMQGLGSYPIVLAGSDAQRQEFLPDVLTGRSLAAFAITETEAGSDVAAMSTLAKRDGEHYVIDGAKTFISNAGIAGHYVVFAKTDAAAGSKGVTAFIVRPDDRGFVFEKPQQLIADHPIGSIRFDALRVPASRRIGAEGEGFRIAMATLDAFRSTVGAAAAGLAMRALDEALTRVTTRTQFGQTLAEFQTTQFYVAEMATELDAARLLIYRAAHARDQGAERVTLEASMAKMFATEAAQRVIDRALQLHGGSGVVRGSIVERLYREVRALRIYEGTTEIQRVVIAGLLVGGEKLRARDAASAVSQKPRPLSEPAREGSGDVTVRVRSQRPKNKS